MAAGPRHLLLAALALLLAACAGPSQPRRNPVMTGEALLAADAATIEVRLNDVPPGAEILAIVLVAPDGGETPSGPLARRYGESGPGYGPAGIGVTLSGGSSSGLSTGVSVGVNSTGGGPSEAATTVSATIVVPDPARLREEPRAWQVVARWIEVGGTERTLPLAWRLTP